MYHKDNKPYTDADLRRDLASGENAVTILPKVLTDEIRAAHGMHPVHVDPAPDPKPGCRFVLGPIVDGAREWVEEEIPLSERMAAARAECARRIVALSSPTQQANMSAEKNAGMMTPDQEQAYIDGTRWIRKMRLAWRIIARDMLDPYADENWPECPEHVKEFADAFDPDPLQE